MNRRLPIGQGANGRETSARHRAALALATRELDLARAHLAGDEPLDLVAECLRSATAALDAITGATTPEALLDRMFARFCVGK
jgi:tRNA modification GTPase